MVQLTILVLFAVSLIGHPQAASATAESGFGDERCKLSLAITIPEKLNLPPLSEQTRSIVEPTHEALIRMINSAEKTIRIASFYLKLTPDEVEQGKHPSASPGAGVREAIKRAGQRGVKTQIIVDGSRKNSITSQTDVDYLKEFAEIKTLNMTRLIGAGILHSKFMIADNSTFYLGSANFDWQAYSHVKESGVVATRCHSLAVDLDKIFRTYWFMSDLSKVPDNLRAGFSELHTKINGTQPLVVDGLKVYLAGSPPAFNGEKPNELGRTDDIDAILRMIKTARRQIDISVMNYSPQLEFGWPKYYWPKIDNALREAAVTRRVQVRLLFSRWSQTKPTERMWYESLNALQPQEPTNSFKGIHVKLYEVPIFDSFQKSLKFSRVKHDKYMVTDGGLYLGTSNWSPDYFTNTCGVGMSLLPVAGGTGSDGKQSESGVIQAMREIFERDFNSEYAHELHESSDRNH